MEEAHNHNAADGPHPVQVHNERLKDMISGGLEDLDSWNSLISEIEKTYPHHYVGRTLQKYQRVCVGSLKNNAFLKDSTRCSPSNIDHLPYLEGFIVEYNLHQRTDNESTPNKHSWDTHLAIKSAFHDDRNTICLAFDSFLSKFPLCHWHWKRYAYHEARLCNAEKAVEIFERAVESTPFSVGLWADYCTFAVSSFEDPFDIRRLFTKGISLVGKDYFCHVVWDKYMSFEFSQEKWEFLALVYVQALRFPTKKLHKYYENFEKLVANLEEEILHISDDSREVQLKELYNARVALSNKEIAQVVKDLQIPSDDSVRVKALYKYRYCGDQLYQKACQLEEKIKSFESNIQRRYFQATPLDNDELKNWHDYLDFIEKQDDFDWALKLYERCLISCANYTEFWIRYVDFMETKGGRELAIFALERATKIFSKNVPEIHLFTARYMEQIGDPDGARASFPPINADWNSCFIQYVTYRANMEKRLGNCSAACDIYKRAIDMAMKEQKLQCIPMLYIGYYRLRHMITASVEAARDVIIDGIKRFPGCRLLYEELIRFAMVHEGTKQLSIVDSIIANAISPVSDVSQDLDVKDRESISLLFLELVDLCGSISEIRKAWSRHIKLFPQLIRTNTSSKHIGTEKSLPNSFTEQRRNNSFVLVNQPSKGPSSGHMIQLSKVEQVHLLTLKDGNQPDQLSADPSLAVVNDKDVTGKQELSPEMKDLYSGNGSGKNELLFDPAVQSKDDSSAPMELSHGPSQQRREDLPGPMDFSYDSIPQPGEDVSKSLGPVLDFKEPSRPLSALKTSQEHPSSEIINRDQDVELEQPPMPVSLENLSLVSGERESQDFVDMHSDDLESGEEIPSSSTGKPQDPINDGNGPVSCSSPATCLYSKSAQTHPGPVTAESSQPNDTVAVPESGSSKVPNQPAGYDQQQQPQQASSQEPHLHDSQGDSQIKQVLDKATVQCQSSTSQGNIPSNQCWTVNNMPQQISMSGNHPQASSSPVSYSQPGTAQHSVNNGKQFGLSPCHETLNQKSQHISLSENHAQMSSSHASFSQPNTPQHSGQSSQQIGALQHQEALNQTSQHYYQQQHLLHGQYQQHQLQMQQAYTSIQQQQMHPHPSQQLYQQQQLIQQQSQQQTPLLQPQQYFQQIQSSQYQQQQYLLHQLQYLPQAHQLWQQQFQQQAQQMQPQEGQQTQQHYLQTQEQLEQYRQSQELAYQMQQHGYQLLLHQYQVHQQGYQCMQQQQQWQQQGHLQLHQYSHLQQQQYHHPEQQTDEDYNQTPQGQQVVEPHSSGTPAPAPESESPETAKQPHSAEQS